MTLYKNRYRVKSARKKGHDYSHGTYFVTICTSKKVQWFGEVVDGKMQFNQFGQAAAKCWQDIPTHFPSASIDGWVVMPNHVHGIVTLQSARHFVETCDSHVSTKKLRLQPQSLGSIINQFKGSITKMIRNIEPDFSWQSRYHDHIIESVGALRSLRKYIKNNPLHWTEETIPWHLDASLYGL